MLVGSWALCFGLDIDRFQMFLCGLDRTVDDHRIALLHPHVAQHTGERGDFALHPRIAVHFFLLRYFGVPQYGRRVTVARFDVPIYAVVASVQLAVREPLP